MEAVVTGWDLLALGILAALVIVAGFAAERWWSAESRRRRP